MNYANGIFVNSNRSINFTLTTKHHCHSFIYSYRFIFHILTTSSKSVLTYADNTKIILTNLFKLDQVIFIINLHPKIWPQHYLVMRLAVSLQFNLCVRIICEGNDNKTYMSFSKKPSKVTEDFRKKKIVTNEAWRNRINKDTLSYQLFIIHFSFFSHQSTEILKFTYNDSITFLVNMQSQNLFSSQSTNLVNIASPFSKWADWWGGGLGSIKFYFSLSTGNISIWEIPFLKAVSIHQARKKMIPDNLNCSRKEYEIKESK